MSCHVTFQSLTAGIHASMFVESAKKNKTVPRTVALMLVLGP